MHIVPLTSFTFNRDARILSADVTDLHPCAFFQVYPDSIDRGIVVSSHHTGEEVTFVVNYEHWVDGDLLYWDLIPTDACLRRSPRLNGLTVRLYND